MATIYYNDKDKNKKVSSLDISKIGSNKFRSTEINDERMSGRDIKKILKDKAYGGKSVKRIMTELKNEGVNEKTRRSYSEAILKATSKKKDEFLTQEQIKKRNLANSRDIQTQEQEQRGVSISRRNTLGGRVKGSATDLGIKSSGATLFAAQNFGKSPTANAKSFSPLSKPIGVKPTIKLVV